LFYIVPKYVDVYHPSYAQLCKTKAEEKVLMGSDHILTEYILNVDKLIKLYKNIL